MNIKFVKSGGFAGINMKFELDSNSLSDENKKALENLVNTCLPLPVVEKKEGAADLFQYEVSIDEVSSSFSENEMSDNLRQLLAFVKKNK